MKKKIISMMLSFTLVITAIPAVPVSATETVIELDTVEVNTVGDVAETDVILENEASTDNETDVVYAEEAYSLADEYETFNISDNGKVVGSNGILYDGVTYLSAAAVMALPADAQKEYVTFCDEIAAWNEAGNGIQDIVMAADDDGKLYVSYFVPYKHLEDAQKELLSETAETVEEETTEVATEAATEVETIEEETTEAATEAEAVEEETTEAETVEEETTEAVTEVETVEEETTETATETETVEETTEAATETETVEEETAEAATETETVEEETAEAATATETVEEETTEAATEVETVEEETTETATEVETVEEETTEIETEVEVQEVMATVENMELLAQINDEPFEVAEDITVERIIDFGYGDDSSVTQFNSTLPDKNHFYNQLTSLEKTIYNVANGRIGSGHNTFSFTSSTSATSAISQAISAVIMTYPTKGDWMDKSSSGGWSGRYRYYRGTYSYNIEIGKSKHYNSSLVSQSNQIVKDLAVAAQEYAQKNYPNSPVYGVVKYFDKWICDNNYYNDEGLYQSKGDRAEYFYCHSSFGILLKGYGVCESYALAMTRLLDTLKIPNMYAVGYVDRPSAGHAWNYVQMPDGKWYLLDSTWNDTGAAGQYLLCADDGHHTATGTQYQGCRTNFKFVKIQNHDYEVFREMPEFNNKEYDLVAKGTVKLESSISYKKTWKSSNSKVAKVDKNGKVTAVGGGTATITMKAAGITATCTVNVHKINNVTFDENNKASYSYTHGVPADKFPKKTINLTVKQPEGHKYTAEQLVKKGMCEEPEVTTSEEKIATATCKLSGDKLVLTVTPVAKGTSKIKVKFGGKTSTLNFTIKQEMSASWFTVDGKYDRNEVDYTGRAHKPTVSISDKAPEGFKKSDFKVTYKNNKNATNDGEKAQVIVSGKGNYGGEIVLYSFTIKPINIKDASFKLSKTSKVFNGANQNPAATVKLGKTKLGKKDFGFTYTIKGKASQFAKDAGTYNVKIVGTGNYTGSIDTKETFEIKQTKIGKLSVKLDKTKYAYTGKKINPVVTVKIGKNVIDSNNYVIKYWDKDQNEIKEPKAKGKYWVVVTVKGNNIEPSDKPIKKAFTIK